MGSIPIARSITHDDSIGLTHLGLLNLAKKWPVLDPNWTPAGSIGPQFSERARRTESWSCRRALFTRAPALQPGSSLGGGLENRCDLELFVILV